MDLLGDLGTQDQLTSVRSENAVLQQRVKELSARVKILTVENESLKAEVELYRLEMALPSFSKMALGGPDEASSSKQTSNEDPFVRAGNSIYPQYNATTMPQLHGPSNNLCCALSPDDVVLASGGADATLRLVPWGVVSDNTAPCTLGATVSCGAPVIAVAFSPILKRVLAVGTMDGSVALVSYEFASSQLSTTYVPLPKKHTKYVRHVAWSPRQPLLATSSADGNIFLYRVQQTTDLSTAMSTDSDDAMATDNNDNNNSTTLEATLVESLHLSGAVEAMCFAGSQLVCYVRDTPHLTYFDLEEDMKQIKRNLNSTGAAGGFSDHVSFAILDLRPFRDQYLAAATDTSRNLILDLQTGRILRNLYGHVNDGYSQPKVAWSASGQYLLGNTQDDSSICVWDVASQEIVQRLKGHSSPIRDLCTGTHMDMLVTTAFDKSTRLWFTEE